MVVQCKERGEGKVEDELAIKKCACKSKWKLAESTKGKAEGGRRCVARSVQKVAQV